MNMKTILLLALTPGVGSPLHADVLSLKSGKVLQGIYQGGDNQFIRFQTAGGLLTVNLTQVQSIVISGRGAVPLDALPTASRSAPTNVMAVPAGTLLLVRMRDRVGSEDEGGRPFTATLETELTVDGVVVAPMGTLVHGEVRKARSPRQPFGRLEFSLVLTALELGGTAQPIAAGDFHEALPGAVAGDPPRLGFGTAPAARRESAPAGTTLSTDASVLHRGESAIVPSGALLEFRLSHDATLNLRSQ